DLKQKEVLVTGSSAGIGKNPAILFAKNGCKVVVTGHIQRLDKIALKCEECFCYTSDPFYNAYSMSKAAIDMIIQHLASKFGPKGMQVNSINSGFVKTQFHDKSNLPESIYFKIIEICRFKDLDNQTKFRTQFAFWLHTNLSTTGVWRLIV
ncbi:hypothetical protein B4U79_10037, partial [Dinothrombium tinctorium]